MTTRAEPAARDIAKEFEDVISGYGMVFRCEHLSGCDSEVEWFGNQHECIKAYFCDMHMGKFYCELVAYFMEKGFVRCAVCGRHFHNIDEYCLMVKV